MKVLFLSTGRTGTRFFADLLGQIYPHVQAHHVTPYSRLFQVLGHARLAGLLPEGVVERAWSILKASGYRASDDLIDSNPHLTAIIEELLALYPDLQVVHIVRDPRDYVRSQIAWTRRRRTSFIANYFVPFWRPSPWLASGPHPRRFLWRRFDLYAWSWTFENQYLEQVLSKSPRYFRFRFEDFFGNPDPRGLFAELLDFLELPPREVPLNRFSVKLNQTGGEGFPDWRAWPPELCARLANLSGDLMEHYGYGAEPEWREKLVAAQR